MCLGNLWSWINALWNPPTVSGYGPPEALNQFCRNGEKWEPPVLWKGNSVFEGTKGRQVQTKWIKASRELCKTGKENEREECERKHKEEAIEESFFKKKKKKRWLNRLPNCQERNKLSFLSWNPWVSTVPSSLCPRND